MRLSVCHQASVISKLKKNQLFYESHVLVPISLTVYQALDLWPQNLEKLIRKLKKTSFSLVFLPIFYNFAVGMFVTEIPWRKFRLKIELD